MNILEESTLRAWREYRNDNTLPSDNFEAGYALGHRDALAGMWKDPKEELPEAYQDVIILYGNDFVCIGSYNDDGLDPDIEEYEKWYCNGHGFIDNVKYWMPIPELPKTESK